MGHPVLGVGGAGRQLGGVTDWIGDGGGELDEISGGTFRSPISVVREHRCVLFLDFVYYWAHPVGDGMLINK